MKFEVDVTDGCFRTYSVGKGDIVGVTIEKPLNLEIDQEELDALGLMWKPKETPDWQINDYAQMMDGSVYRVTGLMWKLLYFHDGTRAESCDCTRVPKPERPELPRGWSYGQGSQSHLIRYCGGYLLPLAAWLLSESPKDVMVQFQALKAWRELTGEM